MRTHRIPSAMIAAFLFSAVMSAQSAVPSPLAQLASPNWVERWKAFEQIMKIPGALEDRRVRSDVLATLDKENQLVRSTLRESNGTVGASDRYGEGYGEYVAELLGAVGRFADRTDPATLRILAQSSYNPDSAFAEGLAPYAAGILPTLIEDTNSDVPLIRMDALNRIGAILHKFKPAALPPQDAAQLTQALSQHAPDPDGNVRSAALAALRSMADVNYDGRVDCADLAIIRASLGKRTGEPGYDRRADVLLRGAVGDDELAYVSQYLPPGSRCQP